MTRRTASLVALVVVLALAGPTAPLSGQAADQSTAGVGQILMGLSQGGGWLGIPIEGGKGSFKSVTVPTGALSIAGCVNVWWGHSGTWKIHAHESVLGSNLRIDAEPGVGVTFEHDFGMTAQVDVQFEWSEPRDTTLLLWVGLDPTLEEPESACDPDEG